MLKADRGKSNGVVEDFAAVLLCALPLRAILWALRLGVWFCLGRCAGGIGF